MTQVFNQPKYLLVRLFKDQWTKWIGLTTVRYLYSTVAKVPHNCIKDLLHLLITVRCSNRLTHHKLFSSLAACKKLVSVTYNKLHKLFSSLGFFGGVWFFSFLSFCIILLDWKAALERCLAQGNQKKKFAICHYGNISLH